MSEFTVYRTLGNGRCLVLDDTRIAGGKPDYRGNNYITSWVTNETYGPVDELKSENAKLRELAYGAHSCIERICAKYGCDGCPLLHNEMEPCDLASVLAEMRELGIEVD